MPAHGRMRVVDIMPPKEREREKIQEEELTHRFRSLTLFF